MGDGAAVSTGLVLVGALFGALFGALLVGAPFGDTLFIGAVLVGAAPVGAAVVETAGGDDPAVDGAGAGAGSAPLAALAAEAGDP